MSLQAEVVLHRHDIFATLNAGLFEPFGVHVEPARRFPLLVAEGFAPAYRLETLGDTPPTNAVVVVASAEGRARIEALPGAALVARIPAPETLYLRLLRTPLVERVLGVLRPPARLGEYAQRRAAWELFVYRVP